MRVMFLLLMVTFVLLPRQVNAEWVSSIIIQQDQAGNGEISMPGSGAMVQGAVIVRGTTGVEGFISYEVDFAYASDNSQTWFLVQESRIPILDGILAVWDTTIITDGDYNLRLVINQAGGGQQIIEITGLHVRNYTPVETQTPVPALPFATNIPEVARISASPQASSTAIVTAMPATPTTLPANPVEVTSSQVWLTFGKGAAITLGIFALLGAYLGIRTFINRYK